MARYAYSRRDIGLRSIPRFREHAGGWTWLAQVRADTWQCVQLSLDPDRELPAPPSELPWRLAWG